MFINLEFLFLFDPIISAATTKARYYFSKRSLSMFLIMKLVADALLSFVWYLLTLTVALIISVVFFLLLQKYHPCHQKSDPISLKHSSRVDVFTRKESPADLESIRAQVKESGLLVINEWWRSAGNTQSQSDPESTRR
jgi:predicted membrane protein